MSKKTSIIVGLGLISVLNTNIYSNEKNEFKKINTSKNEITKVVEIKNVNKEIVKKVEEFLGTQYVFEGRDTQKFPGIDCLGLLFVSIEKVTGESWKKWNVMPSKLLKQFDVSKEKTFYNEDIKDKKFITDNLNEGDIIFFLLPYENKDFPVRKNNNLDLWVWHVAIYSGKGNIIHASPFDENYSVLEEDLYNFFKRNKMSGIIKTNLILK